MLERLLHGSVVLNITGEWQLGQAASWLEMAASTGSWVYTWLDGTDVDGPDYPDCRAVCRRLDSRIRPHRARMGADYATSLSGQPWPGRSAPVNARMSVWNSRRI